MNRALKKFTVLIICLTSMGCASVSKSSAKSASLKESPSVTSGLRVIDAHTHTRFDGLPEPYSKIPNTEEQYFKEMQESGIVASVSHVSDNGKGWNSGLQEKHVTICSAVRQKVDLVGLEADLKSGRTSCIKIYLGYVHRWAYDPAYRPVYQLAQKYDVPVVFHTGDTYSIRGKLKYADPLTVDEVAVDFPKVTFVIAHCGNPWIESAAEVAYKNPNVYLDGSALLIGDVAAISQDKVDEFVVKPLAWIFGYVEDPTKLMYGSDWPLAKMKSYIEAFKRAIPKEHWQAVFHDNAARVFKIKTERP